MDERRPSASVLARAETYTEANAVLQSEATAVLQSEASAVRHGGRRGVPNVFAPVVTRLEPARRLIYPTGLRRDVEERA